MKSLLYTLSLLTLLSCKENASQSYESEAVALEAPVADKVASAPERMADTQKIIRTADLRFESSDMAATAKKIKTSASKYSAQVQSDSENNNDGSVSRTFTLRVPSKNFDTLVSDIASGVSYFDRREISAQDVTEEYIDVEARIKAKKSLEARYLELLKRANKISEMLEIEKQLAEIREAIEVQEGHLRYMQSRISMSTVTVQFYKEAAHEGGATVSYFSKIGNAIASGFNTLSTLFIGLVYLWPFIIIFVIAFILVRRRIRKKKNKTL